MGAFGWEFVDGGFWGGGFVDGSFLDGSTLGFLGPHETLSPSTVDLDQFVFGLVFRKASRVV